MFKVTTRSKALICSSMSIFGAVCPVCIECSRVAVCEILKTAQVQQASSPILHPSNCMGKVPLLIIKGTQHFAKLGHIFLFQYHGWTGEGLNS